MKYNPEVWGPHYWFMLHTITEIYPQHPTTVTKRKFYDFIQNLPLFIPNPDIANNFSHMLDKYPVTPYLVSRDSFKKWMHFIHNKVNVLIGKEEISYDKAEGAYFHNYKPKQVLLSEKFHIKQHHIYLLFTLICLILIYVFYKE